MGCLLGSNIEELFEMYERIHRRGTEFAEVKIVLLSSEGRKTKNQLYGSLYISGLLAEIYNYTLSVLCASAVKYPINVVKIKRKEDLQ
jgi:hypothetical protein